MENSDPLYFVYILYSSNLNKFYVGQTLDLINRLKEHNAGESRYTSHGVPWILLWFTTKNHFRSSENLERKLKNLSRARKIKFMLKYRDGIVSVSNFEELLKLTIK